MSIFQKLHKIEEKKRILVSKAALQRSSFVMLSKPAFKVIRAAEAGLLAVKTGKAVARHIRH